MPYRFRFSLGQLMGFIAISALLTANAIFISRGNFTFLSLISAGLRLCWTGRAILQSSALGMDLGLDRRSGRATALVGRPGYGIRAATLALLL